VQGRLISGRELMLLGVAGTIALGMSTMIPVGNALAAPPTKAPAVSSVSPREGATSGGTEVTVMAKNVPTCEFTLTGPICPGLMVYFGTEPGLVVESTKKEGILVLAPSQAAAGATDVTVMTSGGTSAKSSADAFTYAGPPAEVIPGEIPVVTGVTQTHGARTGFNEVRIQGQHLTPNSGVCFECNGDVVHFGTKNVAVSEGSGTELAVVAPPNVTGTVDVTVTTNPGGTSATSEADHYTYE
jgi:hypothetical protein